MSFSYKILEAKTPRQLDAVRSLFEEYRLSLDIDLCFQNYSAELQSLPGKYAPPAGRLYVLYCEDVHAACGALRPLNLAQKSCELKRLFVRPGFRRQGFARILSMQLLQSASEAGYKVIYLDTLSVMTAAIALYTSLGFYPCEAYYKNPHSSAVYMKKELP